MTAIATIPRRTPLTQQIKSAAFGLLATVTFLSAGTHAFAGTKEIAAVQAQLPQGVAISTATSAQLATAVVNAINAPANAKLNPGIIAGEALKGASSNALDAGAQIAAAINSAFPTTVPFGTKPQTKEQFATFAIKTTGAGKGSTLTQVPGFAAGIVGGDPESISLAKQVAATKLPAATAATLPAGANSSAAGAVAQGRASELADDAAKTAFAKAALLDTKLAGVAQNVAQGVATQITDAVAFTNALIIPANSKNLLKIVPGIAAGQPTQAGNVTNAAFTDTDFAPQFGKSPIVKASATLAKTISAGADIEQIQKVGVAIASQAAVVDPATTKPNLSISKVSAIVTTLAKAIAAKPYPGAFVLAPDQTALGVNRPLNKIDELGELAASVVHAISGSPEFLATKVVKGVTVAKTSDKVVTAILKAAVTAGKLAVGKAGAPPNTTQVALYTQQLAQYVAGSVALTVNNLPTGTPAQAAVKASILAALQAPAFAKSVAGAGNETVVRNAIIAATTNPPADANRFELGSLLGIGSITDPETNTRNF